MADFPKKAIANPRGLLEVNKINYSHQKPPPSSVGVPHRRCCNWTPPSTCATRWCVFHSEDRTCSSYHQKNNCHQRTTGAHLFCTPKANPEDGKRSSTGTLPVQPISHNPTHIVFNKPIYMMDNITKADMKIVSTYVNLAHQNGGTHLDGRITDEKYWKCQWRYLTVLPIHRYYLPMGVVKWIFLDIITTLMTSTVAHEWNSNRLVAFPIVTLQRNKGATIVREIQRCIQQLMDLWDWGEFDYLTEYTKANNYQQQPTVHWQETEDYVKKVFNWILFQGKLWQVV